MSAKAELSSCFQEKAAGGLNSRPEKIVEYDGKLT
jgi:hypothetical protein